MDPVAKAVSTQQFPSLYVDFDVILILVIFLFCENSVRFVFSRLLDV